MPDQRLPRVLFAIGSLAIGGSETQLTRLLENLPQPLTGMGILLNDAGQEGYFQQVAALGLEVHVAPRLGRLWRPLGIVSRFAFAVLTVYRFRPTVIYAWLEESALCLVPVGRIFRVPVVVARRNVSGSAMERRHRSVGFIQRRLERMAILVTVNSEAVAHVAAERGVAPGRIRLVRNGHEDVPALPFPPGGELVIGYLANFRPGKGHEMMMDVCEKLDRSPRWRVLFGGQGRLAKDLRARVDTSSISDRVEVIAVRDAREFWARCHVAVLLSDHEGSPNALIEAAFAGRPLVATAVGGSPEVVAQGAGVLVSPGDVAEVVRALGHMIADRGALAAMGERAREHAARTFTLPAMVQGHLRALDEAETLSHR